MMEAAIHSSAPAPAGRKQATAAKGKGTKGSFPLAAFIEQVRVANPVEEVIGQDVALAPKGGELAASCPFHDDRDPSFYVNPAKGVYYCFGCGASGDVFAYMMQRYGLTFWEALMRLADRAGIPRPDLDAEEVKRHEKLAEARRKFEDFLEVVVQFYQEQLTDDVRAYLHSRAITDETIKAARIGFAPSSGTALRDYLLAKGFKPDVLLKSGLFVKVGDELRDFFAGRIIFPYIAGGRPVYLIGRQTEWTPDVEWEQGKYKKQLVHSDSRPYVSEVVSNRYLYGVDTIRPGQPAFITEGIVDCIMAHQAGLACVTPGTTRFARQDQEAILRAVRRASQVFIVMDNEESGEGQKGAEETALFLARNGVPCRIIELPRDEGEEKVDLADYLATHSRDDLLALAEKAKTVHQLRLERTEVPESKEERLPRARDFVVAELAHIADAAAVEGFVREVVVKHFKLRQSDATTLLRAWKEARAEQEAQERRSKLQVLPGKTVPDSLPAIDADDGSLESLSRQAWDAIQRANVPPFLFQRGGELVRVRMGDTGRPEIDVLNEHGLRGILARVAFWYRMKDNGPVETHPPMDVVRDMLSAPSLPVPVLLRIVEAPVYGRDGTLMLTPGYHAASRTYYFPNGLEVPPPDPSRLHEARKLILGDLLVDFPFTSEAERAHAVAAMLLPFVREMIDGPTPLHLIEAPTPGSGKSLLADVIAIPATGRPAPTMAAANDDEEWRKRITSALLTSPTFILIDNIRRSIDSAPLVAAITSADTWQDRALGSTRMISLPVRCVWLATANNPAVTSEVARRTVRIRIDPKMPQPWERDPSRFKHPQLRQWALANRGQLVWALLTMVQAWIDAGKPPGDESIGSFESWARVIGGILKVADIPGFLANRKELYAQADEEAAEWEEFVEAWAQRFKSDPVGVDVLFSLASEKNLLPSIFASPKTDRGHRIALGRKLHQKRDNIFGGWRITMAGEDTKKRSAMYRLVPVQQEDDDDDSPF